MHKTTEWTPSQPLIGSSLRESTFRSQNVMIKITYVEDVPRYWIKILLEPTKDTPNACMFSIFDESYEFNDLSTAQQKSFEVLQRYLDTVKTEIKEYLKTTICQQI